MYLQLPVVPFFIRTGHISEESEEKLRGAKEGGAYTKLNNMPEDHIYIQNRKILQP